MPTPHFGRGLARPPCRFYTVYWTLLRRELGRFFLERTIRLLNRSVRPDAVLLLGDLIDRPDASDAVERLQVSNASSIS